ncbi:MAG TPA: hypothetical protein VEL09_15110 [Burkholderiales bacterium]|nr:hypothetical protein [Burkholderiales bacterium]
MAFSQRFIEVDGCRINLRRGGSGEPLLYLHGANGAPAVLPFMEKLARQRLAEPMTPEMLDVSLKNRHAAARLAWEPRLHDPFVGLWALDWALQGARRLPIATRRSSISSGLVTLYAGRPLETRIRQPVGGGDALKG